ncbi:hypothetical protein F5144DRAFT_339766 [Chaetomium tenue]|uniref:Uncharacterized protein n=1 Tax=Chaetomium tenue TaxID=1854479 RepID=A0ACB7P1C4_9PEZI|nr:hypothetical protein F5144DRAFT_339766 [Chaetomium globosum]
MMISRLLAGGGRGSFAVVSCLALSLPALPCRDVMCVGLWCVVSGGYPGMGRRGWGTCGRVDRSGGMQAARERWRRR